jgi:hypothetical protein
MGRHYGSSQAHNSATDLGMQSIGSMYRGSP